MAFNAYKMKDVSFKIGTTEYKTQLSRVELTNSTEADSFPVLSPGTVYQDTSQTVWTLELEGAQDEGSAEALWLYLFENNGTKAQFEFVPNNAATTKKVVKGTVVLSPTNIGGSVNNWAQFSVSLVVDGEVTITAAP